MSKLLILVCAGFWLGCESSKDTQPTDPPSATSQSGPDAAAPEVKPEPSPLDEQAQRFVVDTESMITAPADDRLLLLLDLHPHKERLSSMEAPAAREMILRSAQHYAAHYLDLPENKQFELVEVLVVYVENMDEYNRADYAGMERFGSLIFEKSDGVALKENKLDFKN